LIDQEYNGPDVYVNSIHDNQYEAIFEKSAYGKTYYEYEQNGTSRCLEEDPGMKVATGLCVNGNASQEWSFMGTLNQASGVLINLSTGYCMVVIGRDAAVRQRSNESPCDLWWKVSGACWPTFKLSKGASVCSP
jgi:hypothetical protein